MKLGREFLSFAVVGAIGFVVDVAVLYLAAPLLGWYGARVVSFLAAASATPAAGAQGPVTQCSTSTYAP